MKTFLQVLSWLGVGLVILVITGFVLMTINSFMPAGWTLSAELFVGLSAAVLSLCWNLIPGLRVKFADLATNVKQIVNLVLMALLAVVMFLFTCTGWSPIPGVVCTLDGAKALAILVFIAGVTNQTTYKLTPQKADVIEVKAAREGV